MKEYFDTPMQVAFYDMENEGYIGGIAYRDEIICLECGGIIKIADFIDEMKELYPTKRPIIELPWISVSDECLGDILLDIKLSKTRKERSE